MITYKWTKQNHKSTKSIVCPSGHIPCKTLTHCYTQMVPQLLMQGSSYIVYQCQGCILININTSLLIIFPSNLFFH